MEEVEDGMLLHRYLLALGISVAALLISITLDRALSGFSSVTQFLLQVPLLVLVVDEGRRWLVSRLVGVADITEDDINGAFFFAAPLAALGATSLFVDIRKTLHGLHANRG